jgi:hypothetical protein
MQIPTIFVAHCEFCGEQLDIRDDDVSHCVAGWVPQGIRDDDIKLSDMIQPEPQNRWAHRACVNRAILRQPRHPREV